MSTREIVALAICLLGLFAVPMLISRIEGFFRRRNSIGVVDFNESCVLYSPPKRGDVRRILWEELREVGILTTDAGPAVDDVFWVLVDGPEQVCIIPSETKGMGELLKRLQTLPNFDNSTVVSAMGSSENAKFVCWIRE